MKKRILGLLLVAAAGLAGCQSSSGGSTGDSGRGEFGKEADPGLAGRGSGSGGSEAMKGDFQTIYFAFDDYSLNSTTKERLRFNGQLLGQHANSKLEIQGNADERGTAEYNLALGKRRAEAAKRYLIDLGVNPSRLATISFGEENPAVRGHNESAWARNRRDDFKLR